MDKLTKGAVAVGAGVVLLLGGAGTYALWSDSQSVAESGEIASGDLDLELGTEGTWTLNGAAVADVTAVRIVPGDVLALTQPITVTAIGDTLQSTLSVSSAGLTGDADLLAALDLAFTFDTPPAWATDNGDGTFDVAPSDAAYAPVDAGVTLTFDEATPDQVATDAVVDLSSVTFSLEQYL
ncbi:alternate-type signal peptide domain-containing protein [Oerskovia flava]|uniref:alternate-type signal peptide domain-containing protein n=1 Tax=Oerskovia flava TaxID=2986422 RepID=UPI00223FD520|nr:alternate-type signal peptide domain-containing protein [Oerskovia sp. JB1-3-2]